MAMNIFCYQNTNFNARIMYVHNGKLFYVILYENGRNKRGESSKHIGRYPDAMTAGFLFVYLILVKRIVETGTKGMGLLPTDRCEKELKTYNGIFPNMV